jgi:signal transduction histidine kinase
MSISLLAIDMTETERTFAIGVVAILLAFLVMIALLLFSHIRNREVVIQRDQIHQLKIQTLELEKLKSIAAAEEEQMRRIGRYLHDDVGGNLHALLHMLEQSTGDQSSQPPLQKAIDLTRRSIQSVRLTSQELVPYFLINFGLRKTLQSMLEEAHEVSGIQTLYSESIEYPIEQLPQDTAIQLYRLVQEIFTNLMRHAKPSELSLHVETNNGSCVLQFKHNGVGISQVEFENLLAKGKSLGLKNIAYRKQLLNASVHYDRQPTASFIHINLPNPIAS